MQRCQPEFLFFFPVDVSRRKIQKCLFWMAGITLESTLPSCWGVVSCVCVPSPLLPSCTGSAHLHQCETLWGSAAGLPCDGVDSCTKNLHKYPAQGHPAHPRCSTHPISQAPIMCLNLRNIHPLPAPCGNPRLPCLYGCRSSEAPEWAAGQCSTWKVSISIPHCFYSRAPRAGSKGASNGHFPLGISQLQPAGQYNHRCLSCLLFSCWAEEAWQPANTHPLLLDCFLLHWPFYAFLLTLPLCSSSHLCSAKSKP